jgi:hypothetical protein
MCVVCRQADFPAAHVGCELALAQYVALGLLQLSTWLSIDDKE